MVKIEEYTIGLLGFEKMPMQSNGRLSEAIP
jgi:hypothetical protein